MWICTQDTKQFEPPFADHINWANDVNEGASTSFATSPPPIKKKKQEFRFACPICKSDDVTFKTRERFQKHFDDYHEKRTCEICDFECEGQERLKEHLYDVHNTQTERPFKCQQCSLAYKKKSHLKRHIKCKHPRKIPSGAVSGTNVYDGTDLRFSNESESQGEGDQEGGVTTVDPSRATELTWDEWQDSQTPPKEIPTEYDLPTTQDSQPVLRLYQQAWRSIRSQFHREQRGNVDRTYNVRIFTGDPEEVVEWARRVHQDQTHAYKIRGAYGFIMRNRETGELRYFHTEPTKFNVLRPADQEEKEDDGPFWVHGDGDLSKLIERLRSFNVLKWLSLNRPDSKWELFLVTNFTFFGYVLPFSPLRPENSVGCRKDLLPDFLKGRHHLFSAGTKDNDCLCFFRCAAGWLVQLETGKKPDSLRWLERRTMKLFAKYCEARELKVDPEEYASRFRGVKLSEMPLLENLIKAKIEIVSLTGDDGKICQRVHIVHSDNVSDYEAQKRVLMLNLTEVENFEMKKKGVVLHFSLIAKGLFDKFALSYCCESCGQIFQLQKEYKRHKNRGACAKGDSRELFSKGPYQPPPTVFELLEEYGVVVPTELRYFQYWMTWDIEVYQPELETLEPDIDRERTVYTREHKLLVIGSSSNVPNHDGYFSRYVKPEEHPNQVVKDFLSHIKQVSAKAAQLKFQEFFEAGVFRKIREQNSRLFPKAESLSSEEENEETEDSEDDSFVVTDASDDVEQMLAVAASEDKVEERTQEQEEADEQRENERVLNTQPRFLSPLEKLRKRLVEDYQVIPVIGFSSGRYDVNVIKSFLLPALQKNSPSKQIRLIKKGNSYFSITTEYCRFLDIQNYLAPGYSYDKFLKAYLSKDQQKEFGIKETCFPYEAVQSIEWLQKTEFPSRDDFASHLKGTTMTEAEHQQLKADTWDKHDMKSCKDLCEFYLKGDVVPFVTAIETVHNFWKSKNIDCFKEALSLPGATLKFLFGLLEYKTFFSLAGNKDFYKLIRENMVGGPSIIYHRYHQADKTKIREHVMTSRENDLYGADEAKLCCQIRGFDAVSLYLWAIMQKMPIGFPTFWWLTSASRDEECTSRDQILFRSQSNTSRAELEWLTWQAFVRNEHIQHLGNHGCQKRIGYEAVSVDGWCAETQTAFQFHGDYFHGCQKPCHMYMDKKTKTKKHKYDPDKECPHRKKPDGTFMTFGELYQETLHTENYIREALGGDQDRLVVIWECEWQAKKREPQPLLGGKTIEDWLSEKDHFMFTRTPQKQLRVWDLLKQVKEETWFGFVRCHVEVPDNLKEKFSEFQPLFKNTEVSRDDLSDKMLAYAQKYKLLPTATKMLVGSFINMDGLFFTPLLKWYLDHGLKVKRVHQAIQFGGKACFEQFGRLVSEARLNASKDPVMAESMKLVGNSGYGKTATNQRRQRNHKIVPLKGVVKLINKRQFRSMTRLGVFRGSIPDKLVQKEEENGREKQLESQFEDPENDVDDASETQSIASSQTWLDDDGAREIEERDYPVRSFFIEYEAEEEGGSDEEEGEDETEEEDEEGGEVKYDEYFYEVEMAKSTIKYNLPQQIAFCVYQYAKLRMLEFYYDFLDQHLDRKDFQLMEMDTDSFYMALSEDGRIKLDELQHGESGKPQPEWLARLEWNVKDEVWDQKLTDLRTPGLFKVEWKGDGMYCLCSKTYYGFDTKDEEESEHRRQKGEKPVSEKLRKNKISTKGVKKNANINYFSASSFHQILFGADPDVVWASGDRENRSFKLKKVGPGPDYSMATYSQIRHGLSNLYAKRRVCDDNVSTLAFLG
ncbi:uncharacterized protein [Montipora foliosa]|uniref:uncharacterized protein n=1 Tax=Montipora foliosa TaxID=591990 RepID=UPI0035F20BD4